MNIRNTFDLKGILRKSYPDMGWGFCIGAGTSYPAFPSWFKLVENLIAGDKSIQNGSLVAQSLLKTFSPDALIQSVQNKLGLSDKEFAEQLTNEIYSDLKSKVTSQEWEAIKTIFESKSPHSVKDPVWRQFLKVRDNHFKTTSAFTIAKFINKTIEKSIPPDAVISFNAESLLYSLIISFERQKYIGKVKRTGEMVLHLDRVTHSISQIKRDRIKYIFCHGLLLAPLSKSKHSPLKANDKLVFSENAYLNLASTSFSWQSTEFTSYCLTKTMIFIGVSLTDPNMRRWLSWIQKLKELEVTENELMSQNNAKKTFSHFWINKEPDNKSEMPFIEACVQHLGIKIIWIKEWNELESTLDKMIE